MLLNHHMSCSIAWDQEHLELSFLLRCVSASSFNQTARNPPPWSTLTRISPPSTAARRPQSGLPGATLPFSIIYRAVSNLCASSVECLRTTTASCPAWSPTLSQSIPLSPVASRPLSGSILKLLEFLSCPVSFLLLSRQQLLHPHPLNSPNLFNFNRREIPFLRPDHSRPPK